jgi:hypothetical protein
MNKRVVSWTGVPEREPHQACTQQVHRRADTTLVGALQSERHSSILMRFASPNLWGGPSFA